MHRSLKAILLAHLFCSATAAAPAQSPALIAGVGHSDSVEVRAFGLGGAVVVTRSNDGTAKVWATATGRLLLTVPSACPVAVSPDARLLATCNNDLTVGVWNLAAGQTVATLSPDPRSPGMTVEALTFGAGGATVAGISRGQAAQGGDDAAVWLHTWDTATGRGRRRRLDRPGAALSSLAFSPDGSSLLGVAEGAGGGLSLELWDVKAGVRRYARPLPGDELSSSYVFSPDGSLVAALAWNPAAGGGIRLRAAATGREFKLLRHHRELLRGPAFSPEGGLVAAADGAGEGVKLWDVNSGRALDTPFRSTDQLFSLAFSPDGRTLAAGGRRSVNDPVGVVQLWDTATGAAREPLRGHAGAVLSLVFSPDSLTLATAVGEQGGGDRAARLWSVERLRELRALEGYANTSEGVAFSPDDRLLVVKNKGPEITGRSWNPSFVLWDLIDGREPRTFEGEFWAFSPDSRTMLIRLNRPRGCNSEPATVIPQTFQLKLVDVATGTVNRTLDGPFCDLELYALSPDAKTLAIGGGFANNGKEVVFRLWDIPGGTSLPDIRTGSRDVPFVRFSPDGKYVVADDEESRSLKVWSAETGALVRALPAARHTADAAARAALGPGGRLASFRAGQARPGTLRVWAPEAATPIFERRTAAGAHPSVIFSHRGEFIATAGASVELWDAFGGRRLHAFPVAPPGQPDYSVSARFSPDDKTLITTLSAGSFERVQLWDVASGAELPLLRRQPGESRAAAVSGDGGKLASLSTDGIVRLWDVRGAVPAASLLAMERGDWLAVTPDGRFDGRPGAWARIAWRFGDDILNTAPLEIFFNEFFTPGLLPDAAAGRLPPPNVAVEDKDRRQPSVELKLAEADAPPSRPIRERSLAVRIAVAEAPAGEARAAGGGARDVRLFHNGSLVRAWPGDVLNGRGGRAVLTASVPVVAGDNSLKAYAFNRDNVKSPDAGLRVEGDESLRRPGTLYVLAVGINNYANSSYNLRYAFDDAEEFGRMVVSAQHSLGHYGETRLVKLPNERATKANIMHALRRLAGREHEGPPAAPEALAALSGLRPAEPEDAVVVYFSGHGKALGERFYLIQHDAAGPGEALKEEGGRLPSAISDEELEAVYTEIRAGRTLLVIDACNSGQVLGGKGLRYGPMNSKGLAQLAYEKGMYVLAASQGYQAAWESWDFGHGLLTYALIQEGLTGGRADTEPPAETLHLREWLDYAANRVPQLQVSKMRECKDAMRDCAFVDGEETTREVDNRSVQQPRVFYRREEEARPWVIGKVAGARGN